MCFSPNVWEGETPRRVGVRPVYDKPMNSPYLGCAKFNVTEKNDDKTP